MTHEDFGPGADTPAAGSAWRRRALASSAGLLCHTTFVAAIAALAIGLYSGMGSGLLRIPGRAGVAWNLLLALQFPVLHSILLTNRGRAWLKRLFGRRYGQDLAPTSYSWIAALQILATFTLWSPSGVIWPVAAVSVRWVMNAAYAGSWMFLLKALYDGDLRLQTGWIGWTSVWRGTRVQYPAMATRGLFSACRQPIYLGFAMVLWTGPVWTPDRLMLAVIWSTYCVLGPLHKELRYAKIYGAEFAAYRREVPYMLPGGRRRA